MGASEAENGQCRLVVSDLHADSLKLFTNVTCAEVRDWKSITAADVLLGWWWKEAGVLP